MTFPNPEKSRLRVAALAAHGCEAVADHPAFTLLLEPVHEHHFMHLVPHQPMSDEVAKELREGLQAVAKTHGELHVAELDANADHQAAAATFWTSLGFVRDPRELRGDDGLARPVFTLTSEPPHHG